MAKGLRPLGEWGYIKVFSVSANPQQEVTENGSIIVPGAGNPGHNVIFSTRHSLIEVYKALEDYISHCSLVADFSEIVGIDKKMLNELSLEELTQLSAHKDIFIAFEQKEDPSKLHLFNYEIRGGVEETRWFGANVQEYNEDFMKRAYNLCSDSLTKEDVSWVKMMMGVSD